MGGVPEAARVGGQHLVDERQLTIDPAEFEFGVRQDQAGRLGASRARCIGGQGALLELAREIGPDHLRQLPAGDVLVVSHLGLGRRSEDWLRQALRLAQASRELMPTDLPVATVFRPTGACEVAADHAFGVDPGCAPHEHRATGELRRPRRFRKVGGIGREEMRGAQAIEQAEPVRGQHGQDGALVGDRLVEDDVEGGEPVGGDQQQSLLIDAVGLTDFPPMNHLQPFDGAAQHGHDRSSKCPSGWSGSDSGADGRAGEPPARSPCTG